MIFITFSCSRDTTIFKWPEIMLDDSPTLTSWTRFAIFRKNLKLNLGIEVGMDQMKFRCILSSIRAHSVQVGANKT